MSCFLKGKEYKIYICIYAEPRVKCKHQCDVGNSTTILDKVILGVPNPAAPTPGLPHVEAPLQFLTC